MNTKPHAASKVVRTMVALALISFGGAAIVSCEGGGNETGSAGTNGGAGTTGGGAGTTGGGAGTSGGGAGTTGAAGTTGGAGTSGGAGTTGAAGSNATGTAGTSGGAGTGGGAGTSGTAGTGGGSSGGPYTCTMFLGLLTTNEWYSKGFETSVYDGTKFELRYHHFGYIGTWADPNHEFWTEQESPYNSACTTNSKTPDRVVFAALDWEMLTEEAFVTALTQAVNTIKGKYPAVKRIDLMTQIRCPQNKKCNPNQNYGPGANPVAGRQDCYIPPYQDSAMAKVAAAMPTLVGLGPKTEATACRQPVDGTHLSDASNTQAAKDVAAYYSLPENR